MRHLRNVRNDDIAGNALAENCPQLALCLAELLCVNHFAERHALDSLVRNFYTHRSLVRDRCFDTHAGGGKIQRDIIYKSGYLGYLHTGRGLEFISSNGGTSRRFEEPCLYSEALEGVYKRYRVMLYLGVYVRVGAVVNNIVQQLQRRESVLLIVGDYLAYMTLSVLVLVYDGAEHAGIVLRGCCTFRLFTGEILYRFNNVGFPLFNGRFGLLRRLSGYIERELVIIVGSCRYLCSGSFCVIGSLRIDCIQCR